MHLFANNGHATFNRTGLGTEKVLFEKEPFPASFLVGQSAERQDIIWTEGFEPGTLMLLAITLPPAPQPQPLLLSTKIIQAKA